jgi:hypothetical protein
MNTLYALIEQGTHGLLAISEDRYLIQALSAGIIDSESVNFFPWEIERWAEEMPENQLSDILLNESDWSINDRYKWSKIETTNAHSYAIFKNKKELARLRIPVCNVLIHTARHYKNRYNIGFSDNDYEMVFEILNDPQLIKMYAKAIDSTMMIANQELNLTYQSNKDMSSRVYIAYQYYLQKINKVNSQKDLQELMTQISNGFAYGHGFE